MTSYSRSGEAKLLFAAVAVLGGCLSSSAVPRGPTAVVDSPAPASPRPPDLGAELDRERPSIAQAAMLRAMEREPEAQRRIQAVATAIEMRLGYRYPLDHILPEVEHAVDVESGGQQVATLRETYARQRPVREMLASSPEIEAELDGEEPALRRAAELRNTPATNAEGEALVREVAKRVSLHLHGIAESRVVVQAMHRVDRFQVQQKFGSAGPLSLRDLIRSQATHAGGPMKEMLEAVGSGRSLGLARLGDAMRDACQGRPDEALGILHRLFDHYETFLSHPLLIGRDRQQMVALQQGIQTATDWAMSVAECNPQHEGARQLAYAITLSYRGRYPVMERRLSAALTEPRASSTHELRQKWYALRDRIAALELQRAAGVSLSAAEREEIDGLAHEEASLLSQLDAGASATYSKDLPFRAQTAMEALRVRLGPDEALLSFVEYRRYEPDQKDRYWWPRRYGGFVLTAGAIGWVPLGAAEDLESAVNKYLLTVGNAREALLHKVSAARELYGLVMRPLEPFLGGAHRIQVVGDGLLQLVPLQALHDEKSWLADRYQFSYAVAERLLFGEHLGAVAVGPPLVLIGGGYGGNRALRPGERLAAVHFPKLAGIETEGQRVAALLPHAELLEGSQASDRALLRERPPIVLHIAAHGVFLPSGEAPGPRERGLALASGGHGATPPHDDGGDPSTGMKRSALVLAPGAAPVSDGFLTAYEVATTDLWGTQLVVLSACDTGRGIPDRARGVQGLRTAFFTAGASALVTSLWSVDDRATGELMEGFYRALLSGRGRAEALHQASLTVRAKHPDPFYWAPFILLGDTGPIAFDGSASPKNIADETEESRLLRAMAWRRVGHSLTAMGSAEWSTASDRDRALDAYVRRSTSSGRAEPLTLTLLGRRSAVALVVNEYPGPGRYRVLAENAGTSRVRDPLEVAITALRPERMESTGEGTLEVTSDDVERGFVGHFELRLKDGRQIAGQFQLSSALPTLPAPLGQMMR